MRLLGEHFRSDGTPKRSYPSKRAAQQASAQQGRCDDVYRCSFCGAWHRATGAAEPGGRR